MKRYKYPKTFHAPWSEGITNDDKVLKSMSSFEGREVVVTEKMDGQNCTIYGDGYVHARSIDAKHHPSRDWVKGYARTIAYQLDNCRICGENMYAKHSIGYENLESYFLGFSIWEGEVCHRWEGTEEIFNMINVKMPKVLFRGIYNEKEIRKIKIRDGMEGYVIRCVNEFTLDTFSKNVVKVVRADHIQTDENWTRGKMERNTIKEDF